MRSKLSATVLALCVLLAFAACHSSQTPFPAPEELETTVTESAFEPVPSLSQREQDWIEDIDFLSEKYKAVHMDPFCLCPEEEFDWKLDRLKTKVRELSDEDIYFELKAVIAGMGDNHTTLYPSKALSDRMFNMTLPIQVQCFDGHLYLCGYLEDYEQFGPYLLQEIVAINGIDITYLERKVADIKNPYNEWNSRAWYGVYLSDPAFLDWAGCDYKEGYTLHISNEKGLEMVEVPVLTGEDVDKGIWVRPENWGRIFNDRGGDWAEFIEGENGGCVYMDFVSLDSVMPILTVFDETADLIEAHPECGKLVIDLRSHPGGLATRIPQVRTCAEQLAKLPIEQTYVVIGGFTASGAIACTAIFQDVLDAVVIGEPTGQFSSFFYTSQLTSKYVLPNSQFWGWISDNWYETEAGVDTYYDADGRLYPWESAILPDVYISQDIEDIRQGKDSVIEWVLAQ